MFSGVFISLYNCLKGQAAADVEQELASGIVHKSTLDKIVRFSKDLVNTCLEHIQMNPSVRVFWKQFMIIQKEQNKRVEEMRLNMLPNTYSSELIGQ